jgi:hypothetical protein
MGNVSTVTITAPEGADVQSINNINGVSGGKNSPVSNTGTSVAGTSGKPATVVGSTATTGTTAVGESKTVSAADAGDKKLAEKAINDAVEQYKPPVQTSGFSNSSNNSGEVQKVTDAMKGQAADVTASFKDLDGAGALKVAKKFVADLKAAGGKALEPGQVLEVREMTSELIRSKEAETKVTTGTEKTTASDVSTLAAAISGIGIKLTPNGLEIDFSQMFGNKNTSSMVVNFNSPQKNGYATAASQTTKSPSLTLINNQSSNQPVVDINSKVPGSVTAKDVTAALSGLPSLNKAEVAPLDKKIATVDALIAKTKADIAAKGTGSSTTPGTTNMTQQASVVPAAVENAYTPLQYLEPVKASNQSGLTLNIENNYYMLDNEEQLGDVNTSTNA